MEVWNHLSGGFLLSGFFLPHKTGSEHFSKGGQCFFFETEDEDAFCVLEEVFSSSKVSSRDWQLFW